MNNYIKTIQEVLAKPISEFTKTGIAYGAKRAALMEAGLPFTAY